MRVHSNNSCLFYIKMRGRQAFKKIISSNFNDREMEKNSIFTNFEIQNQETDVDIQMVVKLELHIRERMKFLLLSVVYIFMPWGGLENAARAEP